MQPAELIIALQKRGWTQVRIAARTGIPQPTISKVVRGTTKDVMSRSYQKLVALHAEVLAGHGAPTKEPA